MSDRKKHGQKIKGTSQGEWMASRAVRTAVVVLMMGAMATACSKNDREQIVNDTVELAARNAAAEGGEQKFIHEGIDVSGGLDCSATSEASAQTVSVDCTGTSDDGQSLTLVGELTVADGEIVDSSGFIGTADGEEVFNVDCVGETCSAGSSP